LANRPKPINPARVMAVGFMGLIFIGSLLLYLPSSRLAEDFSYIDAIFTAASAVCVTGLVVVDTGTFFTPLGQIIIMLLIFIGSLGFMTMTSLVFIFLGRRISLRRNLIVKEILGQDSMENLSTLIVNVVLMTVLLVSVGTSLLSLRFVPIYGYSKGFLFAIFHAVSAFGNAGFDLFGSYESLTRFPADYLVNGTIMLLFIVGGLGFTVILEIANRFQFRHRLSLHSFLVLIVTAFLLLGGTIFVLAFEYNNPATMGSLTVMEKIFTAFFTAATPRTAGFNVLDTGALSSSTLLVLLVLMFIGASPTSTGGGVKTTTFAVVMITLVSMIRGQHEPVVYFRRFPLYQIMRAVSIMSAALALIFVTTLMLTILENRDFLSLLFEAFSAFGTVGLSTGITPDLCSASKGVLIITMFAGRVGPLSLLVALAGRKKSEGELRYPEENLMIG
jgi:trk system potassium uptake protein